MLAVLLASLVAPTVLSDPNVFPIAVWLQTPASAQKYKDIGINLYVGLWEGPTQEQIDALEKAKMPVVCAMNDWAKAHLDNKTIVGWMHDDEPDNAQALPGGKGYGPPVATDKIVADYHRMKVADPSRPVILNLGQGVAWDGWYGRGDRTNHPEDYAAYAKGCDIASFDIYPVTSPPPVQGDLAFVGRGTQRLRSWTAPNQKVWACIEATRIGNPNVKPTPAQTKELVWQAIVHGAQGLVYFSHQFAPKFIEAGILADEEMSNGVRAINQQVQSLAPVLNSPDVKGTVSVSSAQPVDVLVKRRGKELYVFAVSMSKVATDATFKVRGREAEVLGEGRTAPFSSGVLRDHFEPFAVHLYRLKA